MEDFLPVGALSCFWKIHILLTVNYLLTNRFHGIFPKKSGYPQPIWDGAQERVLYAVDTFSKALNLLTNMCLLVSWHISKIKWGNSPTVCLPSPPPDSPTLLQIPNLIGRMALMHSLSPLGFCLTSQFLSHVSVSLSRLGFSLISVFLSSRFLTFSLISRFFTFFLISPGLPCWSYLSQSRNVHNSYITITPGMASIIISYRYRSRAGQDYHIISLSVQSCARLSYRINIAPGLGKIIISYHYRFRAVQDYHIISLLLQGCATISYHINIAPGLGKHIISY